MHASKLIKYYRTLSPEETKGYTAFAKSPYFNTNPQLVKLAEALRQVHPNMDHISLRKERLYKKIYGTGAYQDNKLRKLFSAGVKLMERFWVVEGVEGDELIFIKRLAHGYRERDLFDEYHKRMTQLISTLNVQTSYNPELYNSIGNIQWNLVSDIQFLNGIDLVKDFTSSSINFMRYINYKYLFYSVIWLDIAYFGDTVPPVSVMLCHFPSSI